MSEFCGVRMARKEDSDRLYTFLLNLYSENALFPMNEEKVRQKIDIALNPTGGVTGIIVGKNGEIEASVGMIISQPWYGLDYYLDEIWNFVHPDYRKSKHAQNLIEFAKWSSFNLNIPVVMGVVTRHRLEPKVRLFQRKMPQIGAWFVYGKQFDDSFNQKDFVKV